MPWRPEAPIFKDGRTRKMKMPFRLGGGGRRLPRRTGRLLLFLAVVAVFGLFLILPPGSGPRMHMHSQDVLLRLIRAPSWSYSPAASTPDDDVLRYVDPLIGTANGGHVFPGATLPYGMVKAGADTDSRGENAAGWVGDDSNIVGFSHLHDSGTGGNPSLGNFPLWVHRGCPGDDFVRCDYSVASRGVPRVNGSVRASPGYFAVALANSVRAEMTASHRAALYRFSFPEPQRVVPPPPRTPGHDDDDDDDDPPPPLSPLVLLDLIDLGNSRARGGTQVWADAGNATARIVAEAQFSASFGAGSYRAYACADIGGAVVRRSGTFTGDRAVEEPKFLEGVAAGYEIPSGSAGAWVQFEAPPASSPVTARVGVSFLSVDQACANAEAEIPDLDFDGTVRAARAAWRDKLSAVRVDDGGVGDELRTTFWSGLYRSMLSPQNYTGENPLWRSAEPYFDSFYCVWDSFRAQHPLLTVVDPAAQAQMVRALVDVYRHAGKLPDCRMSFSKGYTQGGSNADVVVADAFVKGLRGGIDWQAAYEAVVSDAEVEPANWAVEGRGGLVSYHRLGYLPFDDVDVNGTGPATRDISRLVEYAYDDFCISLMAEGGLGRRGDARKYRLRSANWKNIWQPDQQDVYRDVHAGDVVLSPFRGFMQPRRHDGRFEYANPRLCSPGTAFHSCYLDTRHSTYEGSPWLYSFFVPQDMAALVERMGGPAAFVDRLSYWHEELAYMGNEQAFLPVFQFHYGARPDLSSYWAHRHVPASFNASVNGVPGNDDCAMGAFAALVLMGFFPVAGQDVYLLTPPFFREVRLRATAERPDREFAVIRIRNFDPSYRKRYVESATLDGEPYTKSWITHDFFARGRVLEIVVTDAPSGAWGTAPEDLPPSHPVGQRDDIVDPAAEHGNGG